MFVSWPGQDEGAAPPSFSEGEVVQNPAAADLYDAFNNPAGTAFATVYVSVFHLISDRTSFACAAKDHHFGFV